MKTIFRKHFLSAACTLITGIALAQSANNTTVPFKDIQRKQTTDNFTAREIKKKELDIAPSQIIFLNNAASKQTKEEKNRKKKKLSL